MSPDLWNQHNKFNRCWAGYSPSEGPSAELGVNSVATGHLVDLKGGQLKPVPMLWNAFSTWAEPGCTC